MTAGSNLLQTGSKPPLEVNWKQSGLDRSTERDKCALNWIECALSVQCERALSESTVHWMGLKGWVQFF